MSTKIVSYTLETLPALTEADIAALEALEARPDSEIDLSDAPELTEEQWKKGIRGHFYRPVKRQVTARVDADVLEWLKAQGKGYQSRMNAILRREMLTALKAAAVK
ncbi:MAG: BrnA antitoxin family protein [Terracidiphilus sp.]